MAASDRRGGVGVGVGGGGGGKGAGEKSSAQENWRLRSSISAAE
jgi:hypothetical protein